MTKKVSEGNFNRIMKEIKEIYYMSSDIGVKDKLSRLLEFVESLSGDRVDINLEELIANKLVETKSKNPDLNANLYMLYWNLKREKVSEEEAMELYNLLLKTEKFEKNNL